LAVLAKDVDPRVKPAAGVKGLGDSTQADHAL